MDNALLPLALNFTGPAVKELQDALVSIGFTIPAAETQPPVTPDVPVFGAETRAAVIQLQLSSGLSPTGIFDANTNLALTILLGTSDNKNYVIEGRIVSERGDPAANQQLRLALRGFGGELTPLAEGEDVTTDANGNYRIEYEGATPNNIELQLVRGHVHTALTSTLFGAGKYEVVNAVAPALALPLEGSEYDRLSAALLRHLPEPDGDISQLQKARETRPTKEDSTGQQDITFLHQATKWDARLIALNASAQTLSAATQASDPAAALDAQILYGLARVGLPTGAAELSLIEAGAIRRAITLAVDKKLIVLGANAVETDKATEAFVTAFESFSRRQRAQQTSTGTLASTDTLMQAAELDDNQRATLIGLLTDATIPRSELWKEVAKKNLDAEKLQVQGKLAYLTLNNVKLVTKLQPQFPSPDDLVELVDKGYYTPEAWEEQIGDVTPGNVAELVPANYTGDDPGARKQAYARDMARKVRLSYPTAVVGHMLQVGELDMHHIQEISPQTPGFLKAADRLKYRIGQETIETFALRAQADLETAGYPADVVETIKPEIKAIQRLAQLSPSIESLKALASLNFKSASEIVAMPHNEFVRRYRDKFPPNGEIDLVYRKAEQVDATVRNILPVVQQTATSSVVFATALATPSELEEKRNIFVDKAPTLEKLFGSLDFCECEHCRSVFSPAAYLVDLLHFLDPDPEVWDTTVKNWADIHGVVYPFENQGQLDQFKNDWTEEHGEGSEPPAELFERKPFDVLTQDHRPDLPNLQLSCENTSTALPYIDIVNEIQEYYVAYGALSADAARNTIGATTPELLAEPQIDDSDAYRGAYDELRKARYPMSLPFNLWLSTSRSMFEHFETPLADAMELFRQSDVLFSTGDEPTPPPYDRFDIFCEQLGLTPETVDLLIDKNGEGVAANWFALYGYPDKAAALVELKPPPRGAFGKPSAKLLARRLGVTYQELTDLLTTWFINPKLDGFVLLHKLGLDVEDVVRYQNDKMSPAEHDAYDKRLAALDSHLGLEPGHVDGLVNEEWANGAFDRVFVLQTPPNCTFEDTHIRFANPNHDADDDELGELLFKINVFVRLWRGLGWSLTETDQALRIFLPGNGEPPAASDLPAGLQTALIYMSHLQTLTSRAIPGQDRRLSLLTFWSNLPTTGKQPLYEKLFLSRNVIDHDGVFDDPLGRYLTATEPPTLIRDHLPALREALRLTAVEIDLILTDAGLRLEAESDARPATHLTLDTISLLYRYLAFAKAFKLSVQDFITLKSLSKKDPFLSLPRDPEDPSITVSINDIDDDHPFEQTIAFVDEVDKVTASGFSIEALDYLFRHEFDPVGDFRQDAGALLGLAKAMASGLQQIETAHPLPEDPAAYAEITDDFLRQELSILLPPEVVDIFLRMWTGAEEYQANAISGVEPSDRLHPDFLSAIPAIQVNYSNSTQELTYRGALTKSTKRQILDSVLDSMRTWPIEHVPNPFGSAEVRPTAKTLDNLETLLDSVHEQARERFDYFAKHLGFLFSPDTVAALEIAPGVCQPGDGPLCPVYEYLFNSDPTLCAPGDTLCEKTRQDALAQRKALLVPAIVLAVRDTLSRRLISETVAAKLGADPELIEPLLVSTDLLAEPGNGAALKPLMAAFEGAKERGVTLRRFSPGITWERTQTVATVDTLPLEADTKHVIFQGYFEVPARGDYEFLAEVDGAEATVDLRFDELIEPVLTAGNVPATVSDLKPGVPYRFTFTASNLQGTRVQLLVSGGAVPKDNLAQLPLVPADPVDRIERAWILLSKALRIIAGLQLSERELRFFRANAAAFDSFDLRSLPVDRSVDAEQATAMFAWFLRMTDYVALRSTMAGDSDGLIDIFEHARLSASSFSDTNPAIVDVAMKIDLATRIADLTRREAEDVLAAMAALRLAVEATDNDTYFELSALRTEAGMRRLWDVLQVVARFGVPVSALAGQASQDGAWAPGWVQPRPTLAVTTDLRRTVRARYAPEAWQRIAPSIFDPLRQRQRDALVAYLVSSLGFDRLEQLYEYFLVDLGMEPVVQTSRIRMAIASVQLFVQRCLLNLEPFVHPSIINAQHWQWMKRYRVWEANRKIFVYPENWLEPEFRDDKTHLFKELEGTLLAGDVTDELAEDAFFTYLKKLEEIAHLEIATFYIDEQDDPLQNVFHVIGRTASEPRKYFYRRFKQGAWTPWEPVTAEIEGDHIVAIMWHSRLHLFWVTFTLTPNTAPPAVGSANEKKSIAELTLYRVSSKVTASASSRLDIRLNWSDLYQGEWSVREAGAQATADSVVPVVTPSFNARNVSIHVSKGDASTLSDGTLVEGPVLVHLKGNDGKTDVNLQFRVASKHVPPGRITGTASDPPIPPFRLTEKSTVRYAGTGPFQASFDERIETPVGEARKVDPNPEPKTIFNRAESSGPFTVVGPGHRLNEVDEVVGPLKSPFFYSDDQVQLFGVPDVNQESVREYSGYGIQSGPPDHILDESHWAYVNQIVNPQTPEPDPGPFEINEAMSFDPSSVYTVSRPQDLYANERTALRYDGALITRGGGFDVIELPKGAFTGGLAESGFVMNAVTPGSATLSGTVLVSNRTLETAVSAPAGTPFTVVGAGGAGTFTAIGNVLTSGNTTIDIDILEDETGHQ